MGLKRRLFTAAAVVCAAAAVAAIWLSGKTVSQEQEETIFSKSKDTIYFWYTDEALTDYLGSAAVAYGENHDVRVIPVLTSGLEYLEEINKASIQSENPPDLYIISNDSLEKAFLAGLASPLEEEGWSEIKEEYPDAADWPSLIKIRLSDIRFILRQVLCFITEPTWKILQGA